MTVDDATSSTLYDIELREKARFRGDTVTKLTTCKDVQFPRKDETCTKITNSSRLSHTESSSLVAILEALGRATWAWSRRTA